MNSSLDNVAENDRDYKKFYFTVRPDNASNKDIVVDSYDSDIVYCHLYDGGSEGKPYVYLSARKTCTCTIVLTTTDGFVSEMIDVTVLKGASNSGGDDDPTVRTDHTITFKNEGRIYEKQTVSDGDLAVKPADTVKEGSKFIGWVNGTSLWDFTTPVTYDLVLTAKYQKLTISENETSGSGMDPVPPVTEDKKIYLVVGQSFTLNKKGFKSSNTKAASVDKSKGKITAKAAGQESAVISDGQESYTVII